MIFKVNGVTLKSPPVPTGFKESRYNITKANRLGGGKMAIELIAKKRKWFFNYPQITEVQAEEILAQIDNDVMIFPVSVNVGGSTQNLRMYVGEISRTAVRALEGDEWVWKDFTFNLIEE